MSELHERARMLLAYHDRYAIELSVTEHDRDMADTVRELLAENERLEKAIKLQSNAARALHSAERALASADREAAETARKLTDPEALNGLQEANDILTDENEVVRVRADAAEARLGELETENERLRGDAEKWRAHDARKQRAIKNGMLRNPLREQAADEVLISRPEMPK